MKAKISPLDRIMLEITFAERNAAEYLAAFQGLKSRKADILRRFKRIDRKKRSGIFPKIA